LLETQASISAALGSFEEAVQLQSRAVELSSDAPPDELEEARMRLELYRSRRVPR
jgi:hypothetical protein